MSVTSRASSVRTLVVAMVVLAALAVPSTSIPQGPATDTGQTATRLAGGHWLIVGGEATRGGVTLVDPTTGTAVPVAGGLRHGRAHHTATLLPDGSVLIAGGVGRDGQVVAEAELFRPETRTIEPVTTPGLLPRAYHTATVLTDGRVLFVGGTTDGQHPRADAQVWSPRTATAEAPAPLLSMARQDHHARLLGDGTVLIWGGTPLGDAEQLDPIAWTATPAAGVPPSPGLRVEVTVPADEAVDVPTDAIVVVRFSRPPRLDTLHAGTAALSGPSGLESATVVPAEQGMLLFLTPSALLQSATTYTVLLTGVADEAGVPLAPIEIRFTTAGAAPSPAPPVGELGGQGGAGLGGLPAGPTLPEGTVPDDEPEVWTGERRNGRPYSRWQVLPPMQAAPGVTALAGQALRLNGEPLAGVTLAVEAEGKIAVRTRTDATGRFLLEGLGAGRQVLVIDGRSAGSRGRRYGIFEAGVELAAGTTTALPYAIWMTALDTAHAVTIASPTTAEVVVTTPKLPGLEVHLPSGTVIRDHEGQVVREVSLTPVPLDRPPFPLPRGVDVPFYFTVQPGAAYLTNTTYRGARLIYPSTDSVLPGTRVNFWNYDAKERDWYVYGLGTALPDDGGIVPDPRVSVYEFTGAMVAAPGQKPAQGEPPGAPAKGGDPVGLSTGLFVLEKTDLAIPDVLPIVLKRTYRPGDTWSRAFGLGTSHPYDMFLVGDTFPYTYMDLVFPDGGSIHYVRISPGTSFADAVMETTATPTRFYKSRIAWDGAQFYLTLKDGTIYTFREAFNAVRPMQGGLLSIRNRMGNTLTMTRNADGDLMRLTTPGGRWVDFTYDGSHRVTQAKDVLGRTASYAYDSGGRLTTVTDPGGGVTSYTYDGSNRMVTLTDARGILFLTNEYDSTGKVTRQTQADGTTYQFAYTLGAGGKVTDTDVTDSRGNIRRVTFNADGFPLTDTGALGTPIAQTTTYVRQAGSNLPTAVTDALGRRTETTYDPKGNALTVTRLAGTPNAVTTTFTYEPAFSQLASVTNALNQTTTFGYDAQGNLTTVTDPLNHATTLTYNGRGQPLTVTNPLGNVTTFTYDLSGCLATIVDPLGNPTARAYDAAGRLIRQTKPGTATATGYDALNRMTSITDAKQGVTSFTYDGNGNLLTLTDARGNTTSYAYDTMDRVTTRTDPLGHSESFAYDPAGNLSQHTDRKGQVATFSYDALNRRTGTSYVDAAVNYALDAGNRLTQIIDSVGGTISNAYDAHSRLTNQTTTLGTVAYAYDVLGRRTQMTVPNQSPVAYAYDPASRLTSITQGSSVVQFVYDAANRRTTSMLPNGIATQYAYDAASKLTGLTYGLGATVLGDLQYTYDAAGNRIQVGGSWARTGIPQAVTSATYNANNQQLTFGGQSLTYDLNGNLTGDGTNTYMWDARNRLAALTGPVPASFVYDTAGRRSRKTVNGITTEFVYDALNPVQEQTGSVTTNTLTGLTVDEFFTRDDGADTAFLIADGLGSTLALANGTGSVNATYGYGPFGIVTITGSATTNPLLYTGREDDGTGLYYYRARYYHPVTSRFISEDPIGTLSGRNRYAYVNNNPTTFNDPLGLIDPATLGIVLGGLIVVDILLNTSIDIDAQGGLSINIPPPSTFQRGLPMPFPVGLRQPLGIASLPIIGDVTYPNDVPQVQFDPKFKIPDIVDSAEAGEPLVGGEPPSGTPPAVGGPTCMGGRKGC